MSDQVPILSGRQPPPHHILTCFSLCVYDQITFLLPVPLLIKSSALLNEGPAFHTNLHMHTISNFWLFDRKNEKWMSWFWIIFIQFILFSFERQNCREKVIQRARDLLSVGSLLEWLQQPELSQFKPRSQQLPLGVPLVCRDPQTWTILCCFSRS